MSRTFTEASHVENKRVFTVTRNTIVDVYQVDTNFVPYGHNIFALIPIPIMRSEKLVDVHGYLPSPLPLNNLDQHLIVKPDQPLIAINNDRSLYSTFSELISRNIRSDNAGEFARTNKELSQVMQVVSSEEVHHRLNEKCMKRVFTPLFRRLTIT